MVVGRLGAEQPVDGGIGISGLHIDVGARVDRRRRGDGLELVGAAVAERAVPRLGAVLHEAVVGGDVGGPGVALRRGEEEQAKLRAGGKPRGLERSAEGDRIGAVAVGRRAFDGGLRLRGGRQEASSARAGSAPARPWRARRAAISTPAAGLPCAKPNLRLSTALGNIAYVACTFAKLSRIIFIAPCRRFYCRRRQVRSLKQALLPQPHSKGRRTLYWPIFVARHRPLRFPEYERCVYAVGRRPRPAPGDPVPFARRDSPSGVRRCLLEDKRPFTEAASGAVLTANFLALHK